ncbi:MAG: hypothetical protein ACE5JM_00325 [Armatimonadota bacterium]
MQRRAISVGIVVVCVVAVIGAASAQLPRYLVKDLGTLGGSASYGEGMNDAGQVAGHSRMPGDQVLHGFVHDGITLHDVPPLGGPSSGLRDINNGGRAVGWAHDSNGYGHAILYDVGTQTTTDLGNLGGVNAGAHAINDPGDVVGYSLTTFGEYHAFLLPAGGTMIDLGTLGGTWSEALGINDIGQVVGKSRTTPGSYQSHAFFWEGGPLIDLGTLGGSYSNANDINNLGQVVGRSSTGSAGRAFVWSKLSPMTSLGTLGGPSSEAYAIDDFGHVVGASQIAGGSQHAFLYDLAAATMYDLNDFLAPASSHWRLIEAYDINSSGQIAGWGHNLYAGFRAFLASPTGDVAPPLLSLSVEPSTLWPPNGKLRRVLISGSVVDLLVDEGSGVAAAELEVLDEYGQAHAVYDLTGQLDAMGNFRQAQYLYARRDNRDRDGRTYTIWLRAADVAGNQAQTSVEVLVPRKKPK